MKIVIRKIEDWILSRIQKRCDHPGGIVTADILEGCADGIVVKYCNRCGAVKTDWNPHGKDSNFVSLDHCWRGPDPYLWRYWSC